MPGINNSIKKHTLIAALCTVIVCFFASAHASAKTTSTAPADSIAADEQGSLFPDKSVPLGILSHFSWGADIGTSIDMDVEDMSTFNADIYLGYKNKFIQFAGIGAGVHRAFGQGNNLIPIFAAFRSSFRNKPSLLFLDARCGYSFNTINRGKTHGGFYGGLGLGFNLSQSHKCRTHIILAYACYAMNKDKYEDVGNAFSGRFINYAELRFGISF